MEFARAPHKRIGVRRAEVGAVPLLAERHIAARRLGEKRLLVRLVALRQQAKLEFFAQVDGLQRLRVAPVAQGIVRRHRSATGVERLRHGAPCQQRGVEARCEGSGGNVEHGIGSVDHHDMRHTSPQERRRQPFGVAGAQKRQPARSASADQPAQFGGVHWAESANLILQRQNVRTAQLLAAVPGEVQQIKGQARSCEHMPDTICRAGLRLNFQCHAEFATRICQRLQFLLRWEKIDRNQVALPALHHQRSGDQRQHAHRRHGCGGVLSSHASTSWSVATERSSGG